jgi:hypothetical protein
MTANQPESPPSAAVPSDPRRPRRSSGVVVARPLKWYQRLLATFIYGLIEATAFTLRFRWDIHPSFLAAAREQGIYVIWHNRLPLALIIYRYLVRLRQRPPKLAAIVSASQDGGVVARILEHFGAQPVRGSTSRRGPQALRELTTWARRGYDLALTPDGPRGPRYVLQSGPILAARFTGLPVVPVSYGTRWRIRLKTWDRFLIPLPFGRVDFKVGEALSVPRGASEAEMETLRQTLEERLRCLTRD